MIRIQIETIPHSEQRYSTVGDWIDHPNPLFGQVIYVSEMGHPLYEFLVALHELVEQQLCYARGITQEQVDNFDMTHPLLGDPGAEQRAPYHREHVFACRIERLMADELGVDWEAYNKYVAEFL